MTGTPSADVAVAAEWLARLYELGRPAAHEVRNALNGLAVNLEVIRARSARPDSPSAGISPFAEAAMEQFDALASLTDVLLSFMRPVTEPADVATLVRQVGSLLGAIAHGDGGTVTVTVPPSDVGYVTMARGEDVRLALVAMLLAAFDVAGALSCELDDSPQPTLRLRRDSAVLPPLPDDVAVLLRATGARMDSSSDEEWVVVFPPSSAG